MFCDPFDCNMPGFPVHHQHLELAQMYGHRVGDAIQPSHPLLSPSPPAFNLSQHHSLFQWVGSLHQMVKVLELQLHISPSNECSELISFSIDWFDLLAVHPCRGRVPSLKSLLQYYSLKESIFWCSAFFMVQISHLYMTTGKTIALTVQTSLSKVISLLFNILSRFVTAFIHTHSNTTKSPVSSSCCL